MQKQRDKIAVLVPCYNAELTVGKVVSDFREALPEAVIYVFDNNSKDKTAQIAKEKGAVVIREKKRGKGNVVRAMFQKVDADFYVMVDGDDTYPAPDVKKLLEPVVNDQADMSVGSRLMVYDKKAFRPLHVFGNHLVKTLVNKLFGASLRDIMSGYRVMSREMVRGITIQSLGFEVETELTLQCLNNGFVIEEIDIPYRERPAGSFSKLNTFRDGYRVLMSIFTIFRDYKPLLFFTLIAGILFLAGAASGAVVVAEFIKTRFITHVPLAILAVGCILSGLLMFGIGMILNGIKIRFNEMHAYMRSRLP